MKLLVFDVDGTLSADGLTISKRNISSIQKRLNNGDAIAIASGRPYAGIKKFLDYFTGNYRYSIGSNGAIVQDINGKPLNIKGLTFKDFLELNDKYGKELEALGGLVYAYDLNGDVLTFTNSEWTEDEIHYNGVKVHLINERSFNENEKILKVMLCGKPPVISSFEISQEDKDKYNIVFSDPKYLEFVSKETDKATGVSFLSNYLNIDKKDVYCFGDQGNDYLMIKNFNGIAMGNSIDECKKVADFVTLHVKDDGVSYAIENYIKE